MYCQLELFGTIFSFKIKKKWKPKLFHELLVIVTKSLHAVLCYVVCGKSFYHKKFRIFKKKNAFVPNYPVRLIWDTCIFAKSPI